MTSLLQCESSLSCPTFPQEPEWDGAELGETPYRREAAPADAGASPDAEAGGLGMLCVTASAFVFGLVAALVKLVALNVYVMLQVRGMLQWLCSVGAVCALLPCSLASLVGEPHQRPLLFLRSFLYWVFVSLFWSALEIMPVGDATTVVYCGPLFTALFGWLLLGERVAPSVYGCLALSIVGVSLITQPAFLFGHEAGRPDDYGRGMLYACGSAAVGGLLPVLVRKGKECHWATVEHVTALCSSVVFTPPALVLLALGDGAAAAEEDAAGDGAGAWDGLRDPRALLLLGLVALLGFAGLGLQTYGYQREAAARASLMTFLEIPFSYVLQYLFFRDLLSPLEGFGMLLVVSSGLINFAPRFQGAAAAATTADGGRRGGPGLGEESVGAASPKSQAAWAARLSQVKERVSGLSEVKELS